MTTVLVLISLLHTASCLLRGGLHREYLSQTCSILAQSLQEGRQTIVHSTKQPFSVCETAQCIALLRSSSEEAFTMANPLKRFWREPAVYEFCSFDDEPEPRFRVVYFVDPPQLIIQYNTSSDFSESYDVICLSSEVGRDMVVEELFFLNDVAMDNSELSAHLATQEFKKLKSIIITCSVEYAAGLTLKSQPVTVRNVSFSNSDEPLPKMEAPVTTRAPRLPAKKLEEMKRLLEESGQVLDEESLNSSTEEANIKEVTAESSDSGKSDLRNLKSSSESKSAESEVNVDDTNTISSVPEDMETERKNSSSTQSPMKHYSTTTRTPPESQEAEDSDPRDHLSATPEFKPVISRGEVINASRRTEAKTASQSPAVVDDNVVPYELHKFSRVSIGGGEEKNANVIVLDNWDGIHEPSRSWNLPGLSLFTFAVLQSLTRGVFCSV